MRAQARQEVSLDPYPSRIGREPAILDRVDPVLHGARGAETPGPLSRERLGDFERDGFLVLDGFFPEGHIADVRRHTSARVEALRDDASPEVIREPIGNEVRSIFAVHETDPVFAALARDPRLVAVVQQILDDAVYVHQSRVNLKPGFEGKEFFWHSDFETWHVEDGMPRMRAVSCSIHLDHNYVFNGPLMVMRGSHKHYLSCPGRTPANHYQQSLRKQEYGVPSREHLAEVAGRGGIAVPTGPPGSVTLFDCNAMHGSNGNITPFPRGNVFIVYNAVSNALVEPFGTDEPRPNFIANRDFTPIQPS